jgi:hypothetical protein
MSLRLSTLLAALFATLTTVGAYAQTAALGEVSASGDADHFGALHLRTGALTGYTSPFHYAGLALQTTRYTQSGWHRDAPAVLFLWRNQKRDTLAGTIAEAGVVRIDGRTRVIGDATWSLRPNTHTGIELLAASGLVETRPALENATAHTFLGISAERQLGRRFTLIGLAGHQRFTDGNERVHLRARVIWLLVPEQGISAQLRWRQFRSDQLDVGGAYFNPERYREWQAGLVMRKHHAGWIWYGTVAAGRETIDGDRGRTTALAEVRTEGPLGKRAHVVLNASYNRSAGFGIAERYWYRVIGASVMVPF